MNSAGIVYILISISHLVGLYYLVIKYFRSYLLTHKYLRPSQTLKATVD